EAARARQDEIPTLSMPQAVAEYGIGDKHALVIAGTHGKTTITALVAHLLMAAGKDPGFLVGGALLNYPESFRAGAGGFFVVEGDEYDTAYFDKGPKFVHYRPRTAVITSLEFDHADIYDSIESIETSFRKLLDALPEDGGHAVVWKGAERAVRLAQASGRSVSLYHESEPADLTLAQHRTGPEGLTFEPIVGGRSLGEMQVALWGRFSANNVLAAIGCALDAGLSAEEIRTGFASFKGVKRRMEVRGRPRGITVVDDFAHHPTAIRETLSAARERWPDARMWAVFEPRSATTRRNIFQDVLVEAFAPADRVVIGSHARLNEIDASERFSPEKLAAALEGRGAWARAIPSVDDIVAAIVSEGRSGDVVMVCSNGAFDGLHRKLLDAL
ncbi:MAG: Mur ligase family protein, partial [Myxococcota bacterium]